MQSACRQKAVQDIRNRPVSRNPCASGPIGPQSIPSFSRHQASLRPLMEGRAPGGSLDAVREHVTVISPEYQRLGTRHCAHHQLAVQMGKQRATA